MLTLYPLGFPLCVACRLQPSAVSGVQRDVHFGHGRVVRRDEDHRYTAGSHSRAIAVRLERLLNRLSSHCARADIDHQKLAYTLVALYGLFLNLICFAIHVWRSRVFKQVRPQLSYSATGISHHFLNDTPPIQYPPTHPHTNPPRHLSGSQPRFQRSTRARMAIQRSIWRA